MEENEGQMSLFDEQEDSVNDCAYESSDIVRTCNDNDNVQTNDAIDHEQDEIVRSDTHVADSTEIEVVDPQIIEFNPDNPFAYVVNSPENRALEVSIAEEGIMVCLIARRIDGKLILLSGERRLRAALAMHLMNVPVRVIECNDAQAARILLDSNMSRENVTEAERIRQIRVELKVSIGDSNEQKKTLAKRYGKDIRTIERYMELAEGLSGDMVNQIGKTLSLASAKYVLNLIRTKDIDEKRFLDSVKTLNTTLTKGKIDLLIENDYDTSSLNSGEPKGKNRIVKFNEKEVIAICGDTKVSSEILKDHIMKAFPTGLETS